MVLPGDEHNRASMTWRAHTDGSRSRGVLLLAAVLCAAPLVAAAVAQEAKPLVAAPAPEAIAPAPPAAEEPSGPGYRPGFIDAFGRFVGDSAAKLNSQIKNAGDALGSQLKNANEALGNLGNQTNEAAKDAAKGAVGSARDAAGTIVSLPSTRIVNGKVACTPAQNGAPDCHAAVEAICRNNGFAAGRMLDTQSSQRCPVEALLAGHIPSPGDCVVETFVTRAACQ